MGANAQTSVPLFVASTVLTAATQNISAGTGVPVFATTVTRDAAFGGTNKVLAEGQLCYVEASRQLAIYTGSNWQNVTGNIGYTEAYATTAIVANTALTVLSVNPTILPSRLYKISGKLTCQMGTGNAANKFLYITSTPITRNLTNLANTVGANLPQTYQGFVLLSSTQLGVTSGNGTAVTINLVFKDTGNAGALNVNPDAVLGANTSPQQLVVEDIGAA